LPEKRTGRWPIFDAATIPRLTQPTSVLKFRLPGSDPKRSSRTGIRLLDTWLPSLRSGDAGTDECVHPYTSAASNHGARFFSLIFGARGRAKASAATQARMRDAKVSFFNVEKLLVTFVIFTLPKRCRRLLKTTKGSSADSMQTLGESKGEKPVNAFPRRPCGLCV